MEQTWNMLQYTQPSYSYEAVIKTRHEVCIAHQSGIPVLQLNALEAVQQQMQLI